MIPVLGIPILNHPELLQRVFDTIDEPIGRLFVVDNGGVLKGTKLRWPTDVGSIHISDPGWNQGVAASWNHVIKANMRESWWMIGCNDMYFEKGSLHRMAEFMDGLDNESDPALARLQVGNEPWGHHFGLFCPNAAAIEEVGWFDENMHPIFYEDTAWIRKANALGVEMPLISSYSHHDGNQSWKGNAVLSESNKRSWQGNSLYFDSQEAVYEWTPPPLYRLRDQAWPIDRKDSGA